MEMGVERGEVVVMDGATMDVRRRGTLEGWRLEMRVREGRRRAVVGWL